MEQRSTQSNAIGQPVTTDHNVAKDEQVIQANGSELPIELWRIIILHLPPHILFRLRTTSRFFRNLIDELSLDWIKENYPYVILWNSALGFNLNQPEQLPPFQLAHVATSFPAKFSPFWLAHGLVRYRRQKQFGLKNHMDMTQSEMVLLQEVKNFLTFDEEKKATINFRILSLIDQRQHANSFDFLCCLISLIPKNNRRFFLKRGMNKAIKQQDLTFFEGMLALGGQDYAFVPPASKPNYNFVHSLLKRGGVVACTYIAAHNDPISYFLDNDFDAFIQHRHFEAIMRKAIQQRAGNKQRLEIYLNSIDHGFRNKENPAVKKVIRLLLTKIAWKNKLFKELRSYSNILCFVLSDVEVIEEHGPFEYSDLIELFNAIHPLHLPIHTPQIKRNLHLLLNSIIGEAKKDMGRTLQLIEIIEKLNEVHSFFGSYDPDFPDELPESYFALLFKDNKHIESLKHALGRPYLKLALYIFVAFCLTALAVAIVVLTPILFPSVLTYLPTLINQILLATLMCSVLGLAVYFLAIGTRNGIKEIAMLNKLEHYQSKANASSEQFMQEPSPMIKELPFASVEDEAFFSPAVSTM